MTGYENMEVFNPSVRLNGLRSGMYMPRRSKKDGLELDGLQSMATRLRSAGGNNQQSRMIFDKRRSLDRALLYSYQSVDIKKVECTVELNNMDTHPNIHNMYPHKICKALINPDKLKQDYDEKILSVHLEENFHEGDIFEWVGTGTYWLIYLQDWDEIAYFRSKIRRCRYEIEWEDDNGKHSTYAAVRGPVETKIDYIQKHGVSVDNPNYSLNILMPLNEDTLNYFKRYSKFYLQDQAKGSPQVCWRVEAVDWISTPGILEINAAEYYANEFEDDIENGIAGGLVTKPLNPNNATEEKFIDGETFIKPRAVYDYYYKGFVNGAWEINACSPVEYKVDPEDERHIRLMWNESYSGQFEIKYGEHTKIVVVESLF